jgi:hypothetical protein
MDLRATTETDAPGKSVACYKCLIHRSAWLGNHNPGINANRISQTITQSKRSPLNRGEGNSGTLTVKPLETANLPLTLQGNISSHSTLLLTYAWYLPTPGLTIDYDLFLPGVSTARCLATILQAGESPTFVFTPENRRFSLIHDSVWQQIWSFVLLGIEHILTGYDHILFLLNTFLRQRDNTQ